MTDLEKAQQDSAIWRALFELQKAKAERLLRTCEVAHCAMQIAGQGYEILPEYVEMVGAVIREYGGKVENVDNLPKKKG